MARQRPWRELSDEERRERRDNGGLDVTYDERHWKRVAISDEARKRALYG